MSLVLRGVAGPSAATRERVLEAAAQLGYRPDRAASLLASRRSRLIGVVMEIANPFHAQLVEDVQEAAERHGYDLVLSAVTRRHDERGRWRPCWTPAARPWSSSGRRRPPSTSPSWTGSSPWWRSAGPSRPRPSTSSGPPTTRGSAQAVDHLVGLGHRRIAYVDGGRGAIPTLRRAATSARCGATAWATGSR